MKFISTVLVLLCASISAFANTADSFDTFVGNYIVEGSARIKSVNNRWCNLYQFEKLKSVSVEMGSAADESHMVKFVSAYRESKHSIANYDRRNDKDSAGAFAASYGEEGWASNVRGTWSVGNKTLERVYFVRTELGARVQLQQEVFRSGVLQNACYYEADLIRIAN